MAKVSVVLPSYNERENIEEAIRRVSKALGGHLKEIIVVDDNSPDGTWKIVQEMRNPKVRLMHRMGKKGLASALRDGVDAATGDIVVWLDCDLGLPPEVIPKLVQGLNGADVCIGSRYCKGGKDARPWPRALVSKILNLYAGLVLGYGLMDYSSGFAAAKSEVVKNVKWKAQGFGEYFMEFIYLSLKAGYRVTEVGYVFKDRSRGTSKTQGMVKFLTLGAKYFVRVLEIRWLHRNLY